MRKTKIVCTIGPASESEERLRELMLAGMNVARFNFSHGTHEEQKVKFQRVLKVREELGLPVATLLDTKGPEIRLRDFEGGRAELVTGNQFILTTEEVLGTADKAAISYKNLKNDISVGTTILIDDGLIEMCVEEIRGEEIVCRVVNGGWVSNHKGVNVPGAVLSMPYISDVDMEDILFGVEMGYEFIAASFARCKEDILAVREILKSHGSDMKIIAKIENMQGIQNLEEILEASDGVMVARGDMGVEIPMEEVPVLQKKMIKLAMPRIAESAEKDIDYRSRMRRNDEGDKTDITTAIAYATCTAAMDLGAAAIITVTMSGFTAEAISRFKPKCPVIGCTVNDRVFHQLNLLWGVSPLMIKKESNTDALFADAVAAAKRAGYANTGDVVVITAGVPLGTAGTTNMIHVVEVN